MNLDTASRGDCVLGVLAAMTLSMPSVSAEPVPAGAFGDVVEVSEALLLARTG